MDLQFVFGNPRRKKQKSVKKRVVKRKKSVASKSVRGKIKSASDNYGGKIMKKRKKVARKAVKRAVKKVAKKVVKRKVAKKAIRRKVAKKAIRKVAKKATKSVRTRVSKKSNPFPPNSKPALKACARGKVRSLVNGGLGARKGKEILDKTISKIDNRSLKSKSKVKDYITSLAGRRTPSLSSWGKHAASTATNKKKTLANWKRMKQRSRTVIAVKNRTTAVKVKGRKKPVRARAYRTKSGFNFKVLKNPFGGKMKNVEKFLGHSVMDAGGLVVGGALTKVVSSTLSRYAKPVVSILNKVPVIGAILPNLALGLGVNAIAELGIKKSGAAKDYLGLLGRGLVAASLVEIGTATGTKVFPSAPLAGIDYTPYAGVDYTPEMGARADFGAVDYTPEMGASADFGEYEQSSADFGGLPDGLGAQLGMYDEINIDSQMS